MHLVNGETVVTEILAVAMGALTTDQWHAEVGTAQGRTVPATEIPWLRAREEVR